MLPQSGIGSKSQFDGTSDQYVEQKLSTKLQFPKQLNDAVNQLITSRKLSTKLQFPKQLNDAVNQLTTSRKLFDEGSHSGCSSSDNVHSTPPSCENSSLFKSESSILSQNTEDFNTRCLYCDKDCQKVDWKTAHSIECKSKVFFHLPSIPNPERDILHKLVRLMAFLKLHPGEATKTHKLYNGSSRCFNDIMDHRDEIANNCKFNAIFQLTAVAMKRDSAIFSSEELERKNILHLYGLCRVNNFGLNNEDESEVIGSALYVICSSWDHSCRPNAITVYDKMHRIAAQAAISSFFREQVIVPSPVDCPLRNQKINLSDEPFRSSKSMRDGICQTELSLPPNLPKELEDLLTPYFSQIMNQQQSPSKDCDTTIDHDARDASLRRKLFNESGSTSTSLTSEYDDRIELECLSPPPCSPELHRCRRMSDDEKFILGLSPIMVTPVKTFSSSIKQNRSVENASSMYRSTPECSLSNISSNSVMLDDTKENSFIENDMSMDMDEEDQTMSSVTDDEKRLPYAQTPNRRKDRYSSRKNLSHSFSCLDGEDDEATQPIDSNVLNKTDSGFNETDCKTGTTYPSKHSTQYMNDMDVDLLSPRGLKFFKN